MRLDVVWKLTTTASSPTLSITTELGVFKRGIIQPKKLVGNCSGACLLISVSPKLEKSLVTFSSGDVVNRYYSIYIKISVVNNPAFSLFFFFFFLPDS